MRTLATALFILTMASYTKMETTSILDDILVYPIPAPVRIVKRETSDDSPENITDSLEDTLNRQSETLEHISETVDKQTNLLKQLISRIVNGFFHEQPVKIVAKRKKQVASRRSNVNEDKGFPFIEIGRNIPKYGRLATDIFMKEIETGTDPLPLIEKDVDDGPVYLESYRRSFSESPDKPNPDKPSPWCEEALLCKKDNNTICGFDDKYGYGKFKDVCHMLDINCFYRYNFLLAHTCHPTI
ncbi:uncharacterized protein LOC142982200 [Anticarsia gemmatalis]|uniref:uncharacterized protein LOC142982200 n=1 Tax=Anticarsia gemmatalis TaxID=129554 RepID=UPI003F769758